MEQIDDAITLLTSEIDTALAALKSHFGKLRTGRANVSVLDDIRVNYYGTATPLNQTAQLNAADARLLTVKPFDRNLIGEIEKAILNSDLGIMPQNDGELIRLPLPMLTEERRKDLVKQAKRFCEEAKIGLRNHRRDTIGVLKDLEKNKEISQDDLKRALDSVQQHVDAASKKMDDMMATKEKEIVAI